MWTDVDASRTMELVKRLKASPDFADIKVSPLLIMARAVIWAVRRTPMVNAAWIDDAEGGGAQIRVRHYVNLGIAAATPRGLLVPNIKDAQDLNMRDLARALEKLTVTAREGKSYAGGPVRRDDHDHQHRRLRDGCRHADHQPGRGGDRRARHDPAEALGGRRRGAPPLGHDCVRLVRPSGGRRRRVSRFIADVASVLEEPALLLD